MTKTFLPPQFLSNKVAYTNQYVTVNETSLVLMRQDDQTKLIENLYKDYYTAECQDFVVGIVIKENKILTINQYRVPIRKFNTEFVAGTIEVGETATEAIHKELLEEAGIKAHDVKCLGKFHPLSGFNSTIGYLYLITDFEEVPRKLEEYEEFTNLTVSWITIDEFRARLQSNEIVDGVTLTSWALFREIIEVMP